MANWQHKIKIKHLLTDGEEHEEVQANMNAIADVLESSGYFFGFNTKEFRNIPAGDEYFRPSDYANKLLNKMYDYADFHRIWVE